MSDNAIAPNKRRLPAVPTVIAHLQAGMTVIDIARMYNVTEAAVRSFLSRNSLSLVDLRNYKSARADVLAHKQSQIMEAMTPEKIASANFRDLAAGMASLHGMERLERGQSTQNVDFHELSAQLNDLTAAENALREKLGMKPLPVDEG